MSDELQDWEDLVKPPEALRDAQAAFVQVSATLGGAPYETVVQALQTAAVRRELDPDARWIGAAAAQIHAQGTP